MTLKQTPSQTIGPYFAFGLTSEQYGYQLDQLATGNVTAAAPDVNGERIKIIGRVFDSDGSPVDDALVEIWQADAQGRYAHPTDPRPTNSSFKGFGRFGTGTDPDNRFIFQTIKPGRVDDNQAPHINVCLFARGLLSHAYTRIYFSDEVAANATDPVIAAIPEERRETVIAQRNDGPTGTIYRFDVHLQGDCETVFFDV
jgi:protocatechuate 3,4-dioxygenase alpha subunit